MKIGMGVGVDNKLRQLLLALINLPDGGHIGLRIEIKHAAGDKRRRVERGGFQNQRGSKLPLHFWKAPAMAAEVDVPIRVFACFVRSGVNLIVAIERQQLKLLPR